MIYIDKVNKSQINEAESDNRVNFQQEEIKVPDDVLNKDVKDTQMQQITAESKDFKLCQRTFKLKRIGIRKVT